MSVLILIIIFPRYLRALPVFGSPGLFSAIEASYFWIEITISLPTFLELEESYVEDRAKSEVRRLGYAA